MVSTLPEPVRDLIDPFWCSTTNGGPFPFAIMAGTIAGLSTIDLPLVLRQIPHTTCTVSVPLNGPQDAEQVEVWSTEYWPTVRRSHNPFGPQPSQWRLAEGHIGGNARVAKWMAIARALGIKAEQSTCGAGVGALVVDSASGRIVAGAGDARWSSPKASAFPAGAVQAHAAMRVIAMVGRQRVALRSETDPPKPPSRFFMDAPMNKLEEKLEMDSPLVPSGYVCTGLDIFLTHDPCLMCCMAILHSRFERVVFGKHTTSGGFASERPNVAYVNRKHEPPCYGLWFRQELNWRLMGWKWNYIDGTKTNETIERLAA